MILFHGTSAEHAQAIEREGLKPPRDDAGVYLTMSRWYARWAAQVACLRARHERDGDELTAVGLVVSVNAVGMTARKTGLLDLLVPSWRVEDVERRRIVSVERVTVRLPVPGSDDERGMLRAGFGQRSHLRMARPLAAPKCPTSSTSKENSQ